MSARSDVARPERPARGTLLSIGVFARRSRLSMRALRIYDRLGLLRPDQVDEGNGYRWYRESQLESARRIAMLRRIDMPLERIAAVLEAGDADGADLVSAYWTEVERRRASQRELARYLTAQLRHAIVPGFEVREREVGRQLVLTRRRYLRVPELAPWLRETICVLAEAAAPHAGVAGPPFAIYHGAVDEDGDGPVEVCVPVAAADGAVTTEEVRVEPEHPRGVHDARQGAGRVPADPRRVRRGGGLGTGARSRHHGPAPRGVLRGLGDRARIHPRLRRGVPGPLRPPSAGRSNSRESGP